MPLLPVPGRLSAPPWASSNGDVVRHSARACSACASLCGLSSLLARLRNVLPQGSCVKARPRCAHQQDGHRGLAASEGCMAGQAGLGAGGPRSPALACRGTGGARACRTRRWRWQVDRVVATCPHAPRASLRSQGRSSGLSLAGLCAADRDAVEGFPWPGRPRGWAPLGSRSPGLPLAAAVFLLEGDARYAPLAPASRPASRSPLRWVPALTPAPSAWASRRKQENKPAATSRVSARGA